MFPFFTKGAIPAEKFEDCALLFLRKKISGEVSLSADLEEIDRILRIVASEHREKSAALVYLKLEKYFSQESARRRIPPEVLRAQIFHSCQAERALGSLALIFLPAHLRNIRLFEHFVDLVLEKARPALGEKDWQKSIRISQEAVVPERPVVTREYTAPLEAFISEDYFKGVIREKGFAWKVLERRIRYLAPEAKEGAVEILLRRLLSGLFNSLTDVIGAMRAELLFREAFREFRERRNFLEEAVGVLKIMPEGILGEERIAILPKAKLEEEVKQRARELELALSQLREEKRKLDQALENLKIADRAKSDFVTVVSHQFRTPLSVIRWNTETLEEIVDLIPKEKRVEAREAVGGVYGKSVFLIGVLEDIFDILAMEGGTGVIDKKPNQLWEIVTDAVREFKKEAERRKLELVFERGTVPLVEMQIDRTKIRRVMATLLQNALLYTPSPGKVTVSVHEIVHEGKPALACAVEDTGIGVSGEDFPRLFTKFFRGKNAVQMVPDGAGLGLYLAKYYVKAHNGAILVQSELNKGSTFTLVLPKE